MKIYTDAFRMAQSMFSALPVPCGTWNDRARKYMLLFLPVVGLEAGALWLLCARLAELLSLPQSIYALIMCALPYLLSGFIHLDGFMDVCDAVGSWRTAEERRRILKDPHVGSIAVICCALALLASFAAFLAIPEGKNVTPLLFVPVLSRSLSALALLCGKTMETSGYAGAEAPPVWVKTVAAALSFALPVSAFFLFGRSGLCVAVELAVYTAALGRCNKLLDGINGDVSGFCITISELAAVIGFAIL